MPLNIQAEVDAKVTEAIKRKRVVNAAWLTQAVMMDHESIEGDDGDWYRYCAASYVRGLFRKAMQNLNPRATDYVNLDLVLPGFAKLQQGYPILITNKKGEKEWVGIPLTLMTEEQCNQKIAEMKKAASGLLLHVREMERWKEATFSGTAYVA